MFISLFSPSVCGKGLATPFRPEPGRRSPGAETSLRPRRVNGSQNSVVGHRGDESRSQRRRGMLCTEARGGVCVCVSERALVNGCALLRTEVRHPVPLAEFGLALCCVPWPVCGPRSLAPVGRRALRPTREASERRPRPSRAGLECPFAPRWPPPQRTPVRRCPLRGAFGGGAADQTFCGWRKHAEGGDS